MKKVEPKFAKADAHTIRITVENVQEVPVNVLFDNKKKLIASKIAINKQSEEQIKIIDERLANIEKVLREAKKLDITPVPTKKEGWIGIKPGRGKKPTTDKPSV